MRNSQSKGLWMMTMEKSCHDLLLAAVRDSADPNSLRILAGRVADWDQLIDLALEHRILPMVFSRLADISAAVATSAWHRLQQENDRVVLGNLANAAELTAVLRLLGREGIQAIPFKGVVLAASAYGDLFARPGGDLDFLIDKKDLARASALILQRGFELKTVLSADGMPQERSCYEYTFRRRADGMVLELRWRIDLIGGRYGRDLGMGWASAGVRTLMLSGAEVPNLNPEILVLLLCMHGSKHSWSRLIWVCDIAKLLGSTPDLNWERVLAEAERQGVGRPLRLGVLVAARLTDAPVPPWVLRRFEADKTTRKLADYFADHLVGKPGLRPPGRIPYGFQLLDFRDRLRVLFSLNFLWTTDRDREVFGLPERLSPLYYLLRPLRLLWDRSAR